MQFNGSIWSIMIRLWGATCLAFSYLVTARLYGTEALSDLAYAMSILTISSIVTRFGCDQYLLRENTASDHDAAAIRSGQCLSISITISILISFFISMHGGVLLSISIILYCFYSTLSECYRPKGSARIYSILRNTLFGTTLISLLTLNNFVSSSERLSINLIILISSILCAICAALIYSSRNSVQRTMSGFFGHNAIALIFQLAPISIFQIIMSLQTNGYNIALKKIGTDLDVAIYAILAQFGLGFTLISTSITIDKAVNFSLKVKSGHMLAARSYYFGITKDIVKFSAIPYIFIMIFGGDLMLILFKIDASSYYLEMRIFFTSCFISAVSGPKHTAAVLLGVERLSLVLAIASASISLIAGYILIDHTEALSVVILMHFTFTVIFSVVMATLVVRKMNGVGG